MTGGVVGIVQRSLNDTVATIPTKRKVYTQQGVEINEMGMGDKEEFVLVPPMDTRLPKVSNLRLTYARCYPTFNLNLSLLH